MTAAIRIVMILCAVFAGAIVNTGNAALPPPSARTTSIARQPQFRCVAALLQRIVDDAHSRGRQRLYIGPIERNGGEDGDAFVRIYWPQQRAILLIGWPATCGDEDLRIDDAALGWYRTKARIDLDTEVVPTLEDVGGSTYLVDRTWVDRVIAACRAGHRLVIVPSVEPPAGR